MRLNAASAEFERMLDAAHVFWRNNIRTPPPIDGTERWILVEALHQDIRVTLRNLAVAGALRRLEPARLLVFTGTDEDWYTALWSGFDVSLVDRLARAYGADDVLDCHRLVDDLLARGAGTDDGAELTVPVGGRPVPIARSGIDRAQLDKIVDATACRVLRQPRLSTADREGETYGRVARRSAAFSDAYDALMAALRPVALVTSHVDYNQWGLAVESAQRAGVPVLHLQSTGSLKAYGWFPETAAEGRSFRADLTLRIAEYFDKHLVSQAHRLRRSAELVAWRSKGNLGRPSWWRAGSTASLEVLTDAERRTIRAHALDRYGMDPAKPVVAVFNHAVSDALGSNVEAFPDLAGWFEETAAYAAGRTDANWLLLDHPSQALYDTTGFFDGVAARHADAKHLTFRQSRRLTKNVLWSLADVGVTVRGSISNELPTYGIPAIQAGWSEWSGCGVSRVAADAADYWDLLDRVILGTARGERQIDDETVERARLWTWLYRGGADVTSPLVPHWEVGQSDQLLRLLRVGMSQVESDGDPLFSSVRRMWTRREPFLTRFDLSGAGDETGDLL